MRTALYVRLEDPRHKLIAAYAKAHDFTINEVIERLVDQLLIQVAPHEFRPPPWLVEAIAAGHLPFELPEQSTEDTGHEDEPDDTAPLANRLLRAL